MNNVLKNEKFKANVKRVLKKSVEYEKKKKRKKDKISKSENETEFYFSDDISELKSFFIVISIFSFFRYRFK